MQVRIRHFNRAERPVRRRAAGETTYPRRSVAVAAARGVRRYDPDTRDDIAEARGAALRDRLTAMGFTADSPGDLGPEGEQLARAERRS